MQQPLALAAVAFGGAFGSVLRYLVGRWFVERVGTSFPWGTFAINVSGAFVIGIALQTAASRAGMSPYVRLFLATGVLGGYTTFSAFAFEIVALSGTAVPAALGYALGSVVAGVAAAYAGIAVARVIAA